MYHVFLTVMTTYKCTFYRSRCVEVPRPSSLTQPPRELSLPWLNQVTVIGQRAQVMVPGQRALGASGAGQAMPLGSMPSGMMINLCHHGLGRKSDHRLQQMPVRSWRAFGGARLSTLVSGCTRSTRVTGKAA